MIEERFQAPGRWSVTLDRAPKPVRDRIDWFGFIIVTPTRVDVNTISAESLLDLSTYTGVHTGKTDRHNTINGYGPAYLLGNTEGLSWVFEADSTTAANTFSEHIDNRVLRETGPNGLNGISRGTISTDAATQVLDIPKGTSPRQALDYICYVYDKDWQVNPDLTLDASETSALFATDEVIVSQRWGGRDNNAIGFRARIETNDDVESYTTRVAIETTGGNVYGSNVSAVFTMPDGHDLRRTRFEVSRSSTTTNQATAEASRILSGFDQQRRQISASLDAYDFGRYARPGDRVAVYDPEINIYDNTREIYYRGQCMNPASTKLYAVTRPIQQGMGVYFLVGEAANPDDLVDLSDHFIPEDQPTVLELGAPHRILKVVNA